MSDLANDCRMAACVMNEYGTFPSGQSLLNQAANEIERLQKLCDLWVPKPTPSGSVSYSMTLDNKEQSND